MTAARRAPRACADEEVQNFAEKLGVVGEAVAERAREREDPLAHRRLGKHAIDEVSGGVGHAPADTGGTEASTLAREGDQPIVTAGSAAHAHEAVAEQAAAQVRAKLAQGEARHHALALVRAGEVALELVAHDRV